MDWQDLNVAFMVSQTGTVSGAAKELGVHHATVIRHIDRLEVALGQKLFRRHGRGYEATETGQQLFNVAAVASEQFTQARARLEDRTAEISGKIVITTLPSIGRRFAPVFAEFHRRHPQVRVVVETSRRLFRLEYGEAHLAIRAGEEPSDPDNVVVPLMTLPVGLYSSQDYFDLWGRFDEKNPSAHRFVAGAGKGVRSPMDLWVKNQGFSELIALDSAEPEISLAGVELGMGLGFLAEDEARTRAGLVEHLSPRPEWDIKLWQVTHRDMHRSPKIAAFRECLHEFIQER